MIIIGRPLRAVQVGNVYTLDAPLSVSLALTLGTGSFVFARTSTATIVDFEGVIKTVKSGAIRIDGARYVENLWGKQSDTLAVAANSTMTLVAGTYVFSMGIGTGTATFSGTGGATGTLTADETNRTSVSKTITAGTLIVTASVATLIDLMVENTTGQSNQNPANYVNWSTSYNAGTTGCQYFNTINGNTVTNNVVTEATGAEISASTIKGIDIEGSRVNYCPQSDNITSKLTNGTTIANNGVLSPLGINFIKATETATTNIHYFYYSSTVGYAGNVCGSCFVKKGSRRYAGLNLGVNNSVTRQGVLFDLDAGTFVRLLTPTGSPDNLKYGIESVPDNTGVYRIWVSMNATGSSTNCIIVPFLSNSSNPAVVTVSAPNYAGDINEYGLYSALQLERGEFPSSYIPTTTAAVTRNAETNYIQTASNIDLSKGTLSFDFTPSHAPSGTIYLWGSYVNASNSTSIFHDGNNLIFRKRIAGVNYDAYKALTFTAFTTYAIKAYWNTSGGTNLTVDGVSGVGNSNTAALQLGTNMYLGSDGQGNNQAFANFKNYTISPSTVDLLSDAYKSIMVDELGNILVDESGDQLVA